MSFWNVGTWSVYCLLTSWSVSQLDVVAFANLAQLHFIDKEVSHPLRDAINESYPNLVGLVTRVKERAFADWDEICAPVEAPQAKPKEVSTPIAKTPKCPVIQDILGILDVYCHVVRVFAVAPFATV